MTVGVAERVVVVLLLSTVLGGQPLQQACAVVFCFEQNSQRDAVSEKPVEKVTIIKR